MNSIYIMQTRNVIYFNSGTKCILRLVVSIHSLRKHYDGPITIFSDGNESTSLLKKVFDIEQFSVHKVYVQNVDFPIELEGKNNVYLKKTSLNNYVTNDLNVFIDADTIVRSNIDELFELTNEHDFVVPQFYNWTTKTRSIAKRINGWSQYYPDLIEDALNYGKAVNCGVFAFKKDTDFIKNWCQAIIPGRNNFIPDETGMQVILHKYKHHVCDQKYNVSCKFSDPHDPNAVVIHYHGRKHCRLDDKGNLLYGGELWIKEYEETVEENYLNIKKFNLESNDRMIKKWKNFEPITKITDKRITIVTAVNPPYLEKLKTVLPTWQLKPQLSDSELIVMHNGFDNPEKELEFISEMTGRKVTLIKWDMNDHDSTRELMLSSFIYLAPKVVNTPYWLKLDADAYFCDQQDLILDHFYEYDIAGHKWRYTKSPSGESWLATLDSWAEDKDMDGNNYLNEEETVSSYDQKRYGHRRIASFVCLHKTNFTKEILEYMDNRLPVPSHDTLVWYLSNRLPDRKWCWHNFKKLGVRNHTDLNKLKELVAEIRQLHSI